jgi:CBS domain containing-hemolysin-like protein
MDAGLDIALRLIAVFVLVGLNAFFVSAEFALVTVRPVRIEQLASEGKRAAVSVRRAMHDPNRFLSGAQLGITMTSLALGWVGEETVARLIGSVLGAVLPPDVAVVVAHSVAITIVSFILITYLHITLGEQIPKMFALQRAEGTAMLTAPPVLWFSMLLTPFIVVLSRTTEMVLHLFGLRLESEMHGVHSPEEIRFMLMASRKAGVLREEEEELLSGVFDFGDRRVREVMLPRVDVRGIPRDATLADAIALFLKEGHSRYPVYDGSLDNIVGLLYVKDLLRYQAGERRALTVGAIMRPALYAPESKMVSDLFHELRESRTHLAIVVDEWGGTAGIVTLEDLLEEIVGEIQDEYEPEGEPEIDVISSNEVIVSGGLLLADLNEQLGTHLESAEIDTVAGLMLSELGRLPEQGESVVVDGVRLQAERVAGHRIERVRAIHEDALPEASEA